MRLTGSLPAVILALSTLSAGWQALFYAVALVLFVLAALAVPRWTHYPALVALGLAFFVFPFFWNALAAA